MDAQTIDPTKMGHWTEGMPQMTPSTQGTAYSLTSVNTTCTFHIPVGLHGHTFSFLLDTGAAVTLIVVFLCLGEAL